MGLALRIYNIIYSDERWWEVTKVKGVIYACIKPLDILYSVTSEATWISTWSCDHHNKLDDWSGLKNIARTFTEKPPQLSSEARSRFAVNSRFRFMCNRAIAYALRAIFFLARFLVSRLMCNRALTIHHVIHISVNNVAEIRPTQDDCLFFPQIVKYREDAWWYEWDDTALQTQYSKFEPWYHSGRAPYLSVTEVPHNIESCECTANFFFETWIPREVTNHELRPDRW